ncbi:MAG: UbiA family prenyltransferase [Chloroflexota bacterium]
MPLIRLLHLTIFGFTAMLPLIGAASTESPATTSDLSFILMLALTFHAFAYLLNDVVDLPIDRTQPTRANYPLVLGMLSARQALLIALAQIPLAFGLLWWRGASWATAGWLLLAFICLAIYDLWGKKTAVPPLTDLIQGVGWAALLMVGTTLTGQPTPLSWFLFAYITVYILLINGVNASLRDLNNDWRYGVLTTAVWLGAKPQTNGQLLIPRHLRWYAFVWQMVLAGVGGTLLFFLPLGSRGVAITAVFLTILTFIAAFYLIHRMTQTTTQAPLAQPFYMLHIILLLTLLIALFWLASPSPLRWVLVAAFVLPLLTAEPLTAFVKRDA